MDIPKWSRHCLDCDLVKWSEEFGRDRSINSQGDVEQTDRQTDQNYSKISHWTSFMKSTTEIKHKGVVIIYGWGR